MHRALLALLLVARGASSDPAPAPHPSCACEECGPAGAGTYRFAVTPCDGSPRLETATFTVP